MQDKTCFYHQLDAQLLYSVIYIYIYIYILSQHVSSNKMLIFRRTKLYLTASCMSFSMSSRAVHCLRVTYLML
jgi:hypothetical protein